MAVSVSAADATTKPAATTKPTTVPASAATTRPAAPAEATTLPATDAMTNVVDPFGVADQKTKFLKTAGKTGELDAKTFEADQKAGGGLVMEFEKWETAVGFDKNKNGTLDWFEFDAYRQAMRKAVLTACDKNKDNKLTGDERTDALKRLAEGKLIITPEAEPERTVALPPVFISTKESRQALAQRHESVNKRLMELIDRIEKLDEQMEELDDRRDKLTEEEYNTERLALARAQDAVLKEYDEIQQKEWQELIRQFDRNANGELDEDEFAAFVTELSIAQLEGEGWNALSASKKEFLLRHCDDDGDGKLDEAELRAAVGLEGGFESIFEKAILRPDFDKLADELADENGVLDDDQFKKLEKLHDEWEAADANVQKALQRLVDPDGDKKDFGKNMDKIEAGQYRYMDRLAKQALADNGGKPSAATRAAMLQAFEADLRARIKKHDANQNGQLDPAEFEKCFIELETEWLKEE